MNARRAPLTVSAKLRQAVLERDGHACRYCGASGPDVALEADHVLAGRLGGLSVESNLVTACRPCNRSKGDRRVDGNHAVDPDPAPGRPVIGWEVESVLNALGLRPVDVEREAARLGNPMGTNVIYRWLRGNGPRLVSTKNMKAMLDAMSSLAGRDVSINEIMPVTWPEPPNAEKPPQAEAQGGEEG